MKDYISPEKIHEWLVNQNQNDTGNEQSKKEIKKTGNHFLAMTPEAQATQIKVDKLDYMDN